jgi:predicted lipid-binding transport protein (Tim44 family)
VARYPITVLLYGFLLLIGATGVADAQSRAPSAVACDNFARNYAQNSSAQGQMLGGAAKGSLLGLGIGALAGGAGVGATSRPEPLSRITSLHEYCSMERSPWTWAEAEPVANAAAKATEAARIVVRMAFMSNLLCLCICGSTNAPSHTIPEGDVVHS